MADFTKNAIKTAFMTLLNKNPLNKITVKMIVDECGIHRNSFYYHYADIPTLIEEIITQEADRIISEHPTVESAEAAINAAIDFASENKRAILHIYNSVNRDIFERYLWKVCDYIVAAYSRNVPQAQGLDAFDGDVIGGFYKCAFFGIVNDWLNIGMNEDVRERVTRLCVLHRGMPEEMLRRSKDE